MRQAVAQAAHHVAHRRAFQRALIDQPMMLSVIADLALEAEAAAWLSFRFVAALDREGESEAERLLGTSEQPERHSRRIEQARYSDCPRQAMDPCAGRPCSPAGDINKTPAFASRAGHPLTRHYRNHLAKRNGCSLAFSKPLGSERGYWMTGREMKATALC
jgi:hypothetical protein